MAPDAELRQLEKGREELLREAEYVPAGWSSHYSACGPDSCEEEEGHGADDEEEGVEEGVEVKGEVCPKSGSGVRPSGDAEGGYVIYQQTTALVTMLNREVVSVLD